MSQSADAEIEGKAAAAAGNEHDSDDDYLCEVDIPFSIIDGSSDDEKLEQPPESNSHVNHTEKLNENIVMDCFNFSVNAHIKGKFEHVVTNDDPMIKSEASEGKNIDKCNDKDDAIVQNQAKSTNTDPGNNKGWFPAPLPLPAWAASD